ncbi:uncharacterized protein LOC127279434 [Leptopilina boulardi]|uniref:uncharacterized protein LOC127279434 n=1 Tax=Leptopilina boulardi TaxID=63433 RepID=UPI0021F5A66B|nr:uncharacterized protein LOC127279434 [Leptopilina boulardi]
MYKSEDFRNIFLSLGEEVEECSKVLFSQMHFYANLCPVCFNHNRETRLKICSGCKMISYCGKEHQIQDWPRHKEFCKIISNQLKISKTSNIFDAANLMEEINSNSSSLDNDNGYNKSLMEKKNCVLEFVANKIKRVMCASEIEMILFPKHCETCETTDPIALTSCPNCPHANFCIDHKKDSKHQKNCHLYTLCCLTNAFVIMNIFIGKFEYPKFKLFNGNVDNFPKSLEEFINSHCSLTIYDNFKGNLILKNIYSEYLTYSMTISYALRKLKCPFNSKIEIHLIIKHLVEIKHLFLELILHWLPHVLCLKIVCFVHEINVPELFLPICQLCVENKKKLILEFCGLKYRDYIKTDQFIKPNIVIGFEFDEKFLHDIADVVPILKNLKCPFLMTAVCETDGFENLKILRQFIQVNDLCLERNPFSSSKYYRLADYLNGVSATNMFIIYEKMDEKQIIEDYSISFKPQFSFQIVNSDDNDNDNLIDKNLFNKKKADIILEIMKKTFRKLPQKFKNNCREEIEKISMNFRNIEYKRYN